MLYYQNAIQRATDVHVYCKRILYSFSVYVCKGSGQYSTTAYR
jgi:hypothetical protein